MIASQTFTLVQCSVYSSYVNELASIMSDMTVRINNRYKSSNSMGTFYYFYGENLTITTLRSQNISFMI